MSVRVGTCGSWGLAENCTGHVSVVDADGPVWTLECDTCGYVAGLPAAKASADLAARVRRQSPTHWTAAA